MLLEADLSGCKSMRRARHVTGRHSRRSSARTFFAEELALDLLFTTGLPRYIDLSNIPKPQPVQVTEKHVSSSGRKRRLPGGRLQMRYRPSYIGPKHASIYFQTAS